MTTTCPEGETSYHWKKRTNIYGKHETLLCARERQKTAAFKKLFKKRAGVEGTISQTVSHSGIRRARFRGLKKTHLQHLATAAEINLQRVAAWLLGDKPETTRTAPFAALVASC